MTPRCRSKSKTKGGRWLQRLHIHKAEFGNSKQDWGPRPPDSAAVRLSEEPGRLLLFCTARDAEASNSHHWPSLSPVLLLRHPVCSNKKVAPLSFRSFFLHQEKHRGFQKGARYLAVSSEPASQLEPSIMTIPFSARTPPQKVHIQPFLFKLRLKHGSHI